MAITVPTRNIPRKAAPASRDGSASAGRTMMSASGCKPCTIPVANVANPIFLFLIGTGSRESEFGIPTWPSTPAAAATGTSLASLMPKAPIVSKVKPTTRVPQVRSISMWRRSLRRRKTRPNMIWPASWPQPQRAPTAALSRRDRPMESGASAARWSGPERVWRQPARNPVQALFKSSEFTILVVVVLAVVAWRVANAGAGWKKLSRTEESSASTLAEITCLWEVIYQICQHKKVWFNQMQSL